MIVMENDACFQDFHIMIVIFKIIKINEMENDACFLDSQVEVPDFQEAMFYH